MATAAKANAADTRTELTQYSDMGFVLTTDPDNTLPDMDGFERECCGTAESGWISPCEIRAGRDLAVGEKLVACLVRQRDGKMLEQLEFTADESNCAQAVWPGAFASAVAKRKKQVVAGNFDGDNHFKTDGTALPVRLWHYTCANRAFTTAPFSNNQVQALAVTGEDLEEGTRLCIQVRDISTQALYEHHFFSVKKGRLKQAQWAQDLCTALNENSRLLRAGVKDNATSLITPATSGNALWVPQDSDLAVTLTQAGWINTGTVDGATDLKPSQTLKTYVLDAFSGKEVVPAFSYTPDGDSSSKKGVWLGKWAAALKASELAPYVRLGSAEVAGNEDIAADAQAATVWQSGDGIRVFTTAPGLDGWVGVGVEVPASLASYGRAVKNEGKKYLVFRLSPEARQYGVRVLATSRPDLYPEFRADGESASTPWSGDRSLLYEDRFEATLQFDFPESVPGKQKLTVGQVGWIDGDRLWGGRKAVEVTTPAPPEPYSATSPLCEDYGNTFRSEVFDVSGEVETGVDTRTGLFHAHYPVATLQGLEGNGPICDLTLHYSALRGNEAGLGDGWAFRFSSLDTRERRLTLADGITISFDEADWALLGKKDQCIRKKACWVTSCANDYSEFKLDYPSGTREYLTHPVGDSQEPDDALRQKIIALLEQIKFKAIAEIPKPSGWDWVVIMASAGLYVASKAADWMDALEKWKKNTKEIDAAIDYWKRPFNQLLPASIISPGAGKLSLTWNRLLDQFRLVEIKSGNSSLFSATYTHNDVLMKVWEGTDEAYQVDLELKDYLLMNITHYDSSTPKGRVPTVRCSYSEDPTLDRILTRLRENDGSVECVTYQPKGMAFPDDRQPALPRVTRHVLLPGGGQENVITQFEYGGANYLSDGLKEDISVEDVEDVEGNEGLAGEGWGRNYEETSNGTLPLRYVAFLQRQLGVSGHYFHLASHQLYSVKEVSADGTSVERVFDASHRKVVEIEDSLSAKTINIFGFYFLKNIPLRTGHDYPLTVTTCTIRKEADRPEGYLTITEQAFTYNADCQLTKSVAADGTITEWCYYPRVKGDGISISSIADESIQALQGLKLSCPAVPEHTLPPVMAEFLYQVFEGEKLPLGMTLYGYQARECNGRILLGACDIVKLDGVIADPDTWELSLAPGRTTALITHDRVSEESRKPKTMKDGCKAFVWEARKDQTTYFGKESTRLINTLTWEDNPQEKRGFILRSQTSTDSGTETLSTEIRSRYTRRCVVRRQGREEARYTYDLMGRTTSEQRFVIKAGANNVEKNAEPVSAQTTEYSVLTEAPEATDAIISKGLQAITTRSDGHVIRTLTDGLQRAVRRELLAPGLAIGCVLDELECSGAQNVRNQTRYDYYPGGLRRRTENGARESLIAPPQASATEALKTGDPEKSGAVTAYLNAWSDEIARRRYSPHKPAKPFLQTDDSTKNTTVETHLLAGWEVFTRTLDEEVLASGGVRRIENQTTASGLKRPEVTREYDPVGNLIRMKRADVEQPMTMEYDELHRVTKVITPDGSVIAREYFGLSHQVTRLTVDEVVVGTQKVQAPSRLLERRVGERGYAYQSHAITLPDKQVLTTDASESGGTSLLLDANPLSTLSFDRPGKTTTVITHDAVNQDTPFWLGPLSEKMTLPGLSGNVQHQIKTPRATRSAWSTCSLMGHVLSARRTDGSLWRPFLDRGERTLRELHNGVDSLYHYGADGSICRQETVAAQTGNRMSTEYRHDDFGQETFREYEINGARALSIEQRWSDYGLLLGSTLSRDGNVVRIETFSHDPCDRLSTYRCSATEVADYPADAQGRPVKQQGYTWDGLQRLKSCTTTFADDQTLNEAYDYDPLNPTRCLSIKGSSTQDPITLQWSVNGCLEQDAAGNRLRYNAQGQLLEVGDAQQHTLTRYAYDGYGRLAAQYVAASEETCELCYDGDSLCGEIWFDRDGKVLRQVMLGTEQFQQTVTSAGAPQILLLMGSPHSGTIGCWRGGVGKDLSLSGFTPFGDHGNGLPECCTGYNDQRRDPVTGCYHLGNGYRTYNPSLRSFQQPDSLSPFDEGGINDYSYCCNPIDYHDPSGHIMLSRWHKDQMISNMEKTLRETRPQPVGKRWRGIAVSATLAAAGILLSIPTGGASLAFFAVMTALSVTALALEIASKFVEDSNPELARKLGIASMVTGFASIGNFTNIFKQAGRLLRWAASGIGKILTKVTTSIRSGIKTWGNVKRHGFQLGTRMSKVASKGRNPGDIAQLFPTEYLDYIGDGLTRVVKGRLAEMTWKHPTLFRHLRKAGHFYNKKVLGSLPDMVDGLAASLEGKVYRDTYAGLAALYLPDAGSDEADSRPKYKRWAGSIVRQS